MASMLKFGGSGSISSRTFMPKVRRVIVIVAAADAAAGRDAWAARRAANIMVKDAWLGGLINLFKCFCYKFMTARLEAFCLVCRHTLLHVLFNSFRHNGTTKQPLSNLSHSQSFSFARLDSTVFKAIPQLLLTYIYIIAHPPPQKVFPSDSSPNAGFERSPATIV